MFFQAGLLLSEKQEAGGALFPQQGVWGVEPAPAHSRLFEIGS